VSDSFPSGKPPLLIDADGFFKPIVEAEASHGGRRDYSMMLPKTPAEVHRVCQVHFLFRSAYSLTVESGPFSDYQVLSRAMLLRSLEVCSSEDLGLLKIPDWADFFCNAVKRVHGKRFPTVHATTLHVGLEPRLHAWSVPGRREVHVSALTRELLVRINVLLVNASEYFDPAEPALNRDVGGKSAPYLIAYLAAGYYDLNYSRLPVARANFPEHLLQANLITRTQLEFMISHEFGHVVQELRGLSLMDREYRCDEFAFDVVKRTHQVSEVFTALRWLFILVSLDRLLGEILYKGSETHTDEVDWLQEEVRARDRSSQILAENEAHEVLNWTELAGSLLLFSAKAHLTEIGPAGVRQLVAGIREDAKLPSPQEMRLLVARAIASLREESTWKDADDS
jgi:hypothetical protein